MVVQATFFEELFVAHGASVGFFAGVRFQVVFELGRRRKMGFADLAGMFLGGVRQGVVGERGFVGELLAASAACVGSVVDVLLQEVLLEGLFVVEAPVAQTARVRVELDVHEDVVVQVRLLGELLTADGADVRFVSGVCHDVLLQIAFLLESLVADVTCVVLDPYVSLNVFVEVALLGEAFVAYGTDMGPLAGVDEGVDLQGIFSGEGFVADVADVRVVVDVREVVLL